jgi:hypothetical protein
VRPLDDLEDHVPLALDRLQRLPPDPVHSARVRARCHAQLARSRRRSEQIAALAVGVRRLLVPAVVLAGCALYVASLVRTVLQVRSLF